MPESELTVPIAQGSELQLGSKSVVLGETAGSRLGSDSSPCPPWMTYWEPVAGTGAVSGSTAPCVPVVGNTAVLRIGKQGYGGPSQGNAHEQPHCIFEGSVHSELFDMAAAAERWRYRSCRTSRVFVVSYRTAMQMHVVYRRLVADLLASSSGLELCDFRRLEMLAARWGELLAVGTLLECQAGVVYHPSSLLDTGLSNPSSDAVTAEFQKKP